VDVRLVGTHYEPHVGGIETYMRELATSLAGRGVTASVTCVAPGAEWAPAAVREVRDGIPVHRVTARGVGGGLRWPEPLGELSRADVLHFNGFSRPLLVRLLRDRGATPWVVTLHGGVEGAKDDPIRPRRWAKSAFDRAFARLALASATRVICVRESEAEHLRRALGVPAAKLLVWPNFVPGSVDHEPAEVEPSGRLLVLARLSRVKRIGDLVRTLAEHPDLPGCDVAGPDGDDAAALRELVEGLPPGRVRLLGAVEGERKRTLLRSAKAVVLCSDGEGHSLAALEAIAAGTPVVASTGACAGLDAAAILTYPTGDRSALAACLGDLDDPAVRAGLDRGLSAARHALVARDEYVDRLLALYEEAAA
jgi:glycosyltransferase involved in cell wall biosynthesis